MSFTLAKALKEHVEKTHFKEQTKNTNTVESVNPIEQTEYILEPGTFLELKSQSDIESEADEDVSLEGSEGESGMSSMLKLSIGRIEL